MSNTKNTLGMKLWTFGLLFIILTWFIVIIRSNTKEPVLPSKYHTICEQVGRTLSRCENIEVVCYISYDNGIDCYEKGDKYE